MDKPKNKSKRATIYDVARALNLSTATVNRALSGKDTIHEDTRREVLEMVERLGYKPNRLARSLASRDIRLAVIAFTSFPEFHDPIVLGARQALKDLSDYNIHVDFFSYDKGDSNTEAGTKFLDELLEQVAASAYDGLLVCARQSRGFDRIVEKGVPVVTVVNDFEIRMRRLSIQYDGRAAGRIAAELLYRFGDRNRPVAIATGRFGKHSIHSDILEGFLQQTEVTPLSLATIYNHHDNRAEAYELTAGMLREHPTLGGIYVDSFNSQGVVEAVRDAGMGGKLCLITSDMYERLRGYIRQGLVQASLCQNQYEQGRQGLERLYWYLVEGSQGPDTVLLPPQIVLNSNLDLY